MRVSTKIVHKIISCLAVLGTMIFIPCISFAQTTGFITEHNRNRIERAVDSFVTAHKYKLGIFRFRPQLTINAGFDTNSRYGSDDRDHKADFFFSIVPGLSSGIKLGSRAFFRVEENVTFLYYLRQKQRRDNYGSTAGEFVTGTARVLARVHGTYSSKTEPVNEEIDEPVDQTITTLRAGVDYALTSRIGLGHSIGYTETEFKINENVFGDFIPLNDRKTIAVVNGASYALSERVLFTVDLGLARSKATETNSESNRWALLFGTNYRRDRFTARAGVGYGETRNESLDVPIRSILINSGVNFLLGQRSNLGITANRFQEFSYLDQNATRNTTRVGVNYNTPLIKRISLYGSYFIGRNDYGDQLISGNTVNHDTFQQADLGANVAIYRSIGVHGGITYLNRNTDLPGLDKNRFTYYFGFGLGYSVNILDLFL